MSSKIPSKERNLNPFSPLRPSGAVAGLMHLSYVQHCPVGSQGAWRSVLLELSPLQASRIQGTTQIDFFRKNGLKKNQLYCNIIYIQSNSPTVSVQFVLTNANTHPRTVGHNRDRHTLRVFLLESSSARSRGRVPPPQDTAPPGALTDALVCPQWSNPALTPRP